MPHPSHAMGTRAAAPARTGAPSRAGAPARFGRWHFYLKDAAGSGKVKPGSTTPAKASRPGKGASSADSSAAQAPATPVALVSPREAPPSAASKAATPPARKALEMAGVAGEKREREGGRERSPGGGGSAQSSPAGAGKQKKARSHPQAAPSGMAAVRETLTMHITREQDPADATMRQTKVRILP